jgi:hypothetical protein
MKMFARHESDFSSDKRRAVVGQSLPTWFASVPGMHNDGPVLQRKSNCACGGGCPRCEQESANLMVQTKLAISSPGDASEQEADAVADQVMRMPDPTVQRKCQSCAADPASNSNYEETPQIRRRMSGGGGSGEVSADFTSRLSAGQRLDNATRSFFEPRFGRDFSSVRVHSDHGANESAAAIHARAFTLGRDVVFGAGQWSPGTTAGQTLLAHELAHVAQQSGDAPGPIRRAPAEGNLLTPETPVPLDEPNKAPGCDDVCGNSAAKCVQEPGEHCDAAMTKKVGDAWTTAGWQLSLAKDAMSQSPLSSTTLTSLKNNFKWSTGSSPANLPSTIATNIDTAITKQADNLCIKCATECPEGASAQIYRARGQNCLGSNCFRICPNFTANDTHVLIHELFHRVVSSVEDLYRGQSTYPPEPPTALKMPDCYASLIDDVAPRAAATKAAADAAAAEKKAAAGTK